MSLLYIKIADKVGGIVSLLHMKLYHKRTIAQLEDGRMTKSWERSAMQLLTYLAALLKPLCRANPDKIDILPKCGIGTQTRDQKNQHQIR